MMAASTSIVSNMKSPQIPLLRVLIGVYCFCAAAAFQTTHITNSQVPASSASSSRGRLSSASSSRGRLSSTLAEDDKVRTVWDIDNDQKERKWFPIHPADALSGGRLYLD